MSATTRVFADVARNRELRLVTPRSPLRRHRVRRVDRDARLRLRPRRRRHLRTGRTRPAGARAAVVAPLVAPMADRRSPVTVLMGGYVTQAVGHGCHRALHPARPAARRPTLGAVVAATAVATTRPAQAALVPALTREVQQLTAANVVFGWVDSLSVLVAGGGVGLALAFGGVGLRLRGRHRAARAAATCWSFRCALPPREARARRRGRATGERSAGSRVRRGAGEAQPPGCSSVCSVPSSP